MARHVSTFLAAAAVLSLSGVRSFAQPVEDATAIVQNAVVEGIQISSEKGATGDEQVVTCYFIFRDKPSSYFWEAKPAEKKIVFEFNDTEIGNSPISSQAAPPITGFELEKKRINVNEQIKGLTPEWHDVVVVTFTITAVPDITVTDQYNIINFSYKWSTDPAKLGQYAVVQKKKPILPIALGAVGLGAIGAIVAAVVLGGDDVVEPDQPLSISDLPRHEPQQ